MLGDSASLRRIVLPRNFASCTGCLSGLERASPESVQLGSRGCRREHGPWLQTTVTSADDGHEDDGVFMRASGLATCQVICFLFPSVLGKSQNDARNLHQI